MPTTRRRTREAACQGDDQDQDHERDYSNGVPRGIAEPATKKAQNAKMTTAKTAATTARETTHATPSSKARPAAAVDSQRDSHGRAYWLMKAEPESRLEKGADVKFSIDDLRTASEPVPWDGVRNSEARNNMRAMKKGDLAFFYHSNCKTPGIVGIMQIVREHSVDETAFDPSHPYHDPKSDRNNPRWSVVHVVFRQQFARPITLAVIKDRFARGPTAPLSEMQLVQRPRLSVSRVGAGEWEFLVGIAEADAETEG